MKINVSVPGALATCPAFKDLLQHRCGTRRDQGLWTLAKALQTTVPTGHGAHHSLRLEFEDPAPAWSLRSLAAELLDSHRPQLTAAQIGAANKTLDRSRNALHAWADATWPVGTGIGTPAGPQRVERNLVLAASIRICTTADGTSHSWTHNQLQDWKNQHQDTPA